MSHSSKGQFVTKDDCQQTTTAFRQDLSVLKNALIGSDMRGGIVQDVSAMKSDISAMKSMLKNNGYSKGLGKKERALIYCSVITSGGVVVAEVVRVLFIH